MKSITLTSAELIVASNIAVMRRVSNLKRGIAAKYGAPDKEGSWEIDIVACMGEMAVAKHFNLFWLGSINDFGAVDVGGLIEVRTRRQSWHQLILHPSDKDDVPFVLVHADPPQFNFVGWILARDGKQQKYWSDPAGGRPAFFVPQDELHPIETLRVDIEVQYGVVADGAAEAVKRHRQFEYISGLTDEERHERSANLQHSAAK